MPFFNVLKSCKNTSARIGILETGHGKINTPCFMPIGTYAAIKTLSSDEIKKLNYKLILSNAYHLYLRPGTAILEKYNGLHNFMDWDGSILTDSGGFQIASGALKWDKLLKEKVFKWLEYNSDIATCIPQPS